MANRTAMLRAVAALSEVLADGGVWYDEEERALNAALDLLMQKVSRR